MSKRTEPEAGHMATIVVAGGIYAQGIYAGRDSADRHQVDIGGRILSGRLVLPFCPDRRSPAR